MSDDVELLRRVYELFNRREIERVLAAMHPDVVWANGMEGGHVHGRDEVRSYWKRQWAILDPHVDPVEISANGEGEAVVKVRRGPGAVLDSSRVGPDGLAPKSRELQCAKDCKLSRVFWTQGKFGWLELHPEKTRRIEFGRFAEENRKRRGEGKTRDVRFPGLQAYQREEQAWVVHGATHDDPQAHANEATTD